MGNPFAQDGEPKVLWASYRTGLMANLQRVTRARLPDEAQNEVDPAIAPLLKAGGPETWERLYEAEQRLVPYFSAAEVDADFARRAAEAEHLGVASIGALKAEFDSQPSGSDQRAALLLTLIEDIHFRYAKRRLDRSERNKKILTFNLVGIIFILLFLALVFGAFSGTWFTAETQLVLVIGTMGAIGAFFSRSIELQGGEGQLDYDKIVYSYSYRTLVLRIIIGIMAAVIVYMMISAGIFGLIFSDDMLPDLTKIADDVKKGAAFLANPSTEMAKLLIWSFFAGFSERLVSRALTKIDSTEGNGKP